MSFKLLAVRPLDGCNKKLLKNLNENQIYQFYNNYEFVDGIGQTLKDYPEQKSVKLANKIETNVPEDLYGKNINVSAIVGKNGSGKSALIELLIATIAKVSKIIDKDFIDPEELYYRDENNLNKFEENVGRFNKSFKQDLKRLRVEIYFEHKTEVPGINNVGRIKTYNSGNVVKIRCIQLIDEKIFINDQIGENVICFSIDDLDDANPYNQNINQELFYFFKDLFYTMVINYSHYGFNSNEIGEWVKGIFHKNDGYQLPVVINPYRDKGNIDINVEKELVKSRFLVNILQEEKLREIQKNKSITHITIELDYSKFLWDMRSNGDKRINNTRKEKDLILNLIFEKFHFEKEANDNKQNYFFAFAFDYLLIKLKKISNYPIYNQYRRCFEESTIEYEGNKIQQIKIIPNELFANYLDSLFSNFSHVTQKFKQALFFLQYCYIDRNDIIYNKEKKIVDINELYEWINSAFLKSLDNAIKRFDSEEEKLFKQTLQKQLITRKFSSQHSLPSFFKIEYYFQNEINDNNLSNCSSGEKQKIFSIHSVVYHLKNLISIKENNAVGLNSSIVKLITYKNINIVFDEIELYAHPDFQRTFIIDLLDSLKTIEIKEYFLNIIFITHSPFILSDIPKENVLFLEINEISEKAEPSLYDGFNTFGANIHELLTDGFFMDSTKGAFSLSKIKSLLKFFQKVKFGKENEIEDLVKYYNQNKEEYHSIIKIIGEDYIRNILENHIIEVEDKLGIQNFDSLINKEKELLAKLELIRNKLNK